MNTRDSMRGWPEGALNLLYPSLCALCEGISDTPWPLCSGCETYLAPLSRPFCERCAEPLPTGVYGAAPQAEWLCEHCEDIRWRLDGAVCALRGTAAALELVHAFKYGRQAHLAPLLAARLAGVSADPRISMRRFDALVPVPLHPLRERQRGFNQADLLAEQVSRRLGEIPVRKLLRRVRETGSQTRLSRAGRLRNLRGAFALGGRGLAWWRESPTDWVRGRTLLLVDDVFTTGSTLDECAGVLKTAGAAEVWAIALIRAGRH